ncbi:odorant receptor 4 [Leptinotarsa decemlineata]|uniref:odorant receptor 4 n=1 Tax=Leptinotarsa decemlineata TaxID=7539 RepID=UPI003D309DC6
MIRLFYFLYVAILFSCGFVIAICECMIFKESIKKISTFASQIGMILTHFAGIVKLCLLTFGHGKLLRLIQVLEDKKYQYESLGESKPGVMLQEGMKIYNITTYSVFVLYGFVGISGHISSLINLNLEIQGDTFEGTNKTCYDFLPYMFYIPLPHQLKWQCELALTFMDIGFAMHASVIAVHDTLFSGLLNYLKTQLLIVCEVFKTLRVRCLKNIGLPKDYIIMHDTDNPVLERELYRLLTHATEHLKILLRIREDLEYMFTYVILIQAIASLFIISSCLYVGYIVPFGSPEMIALMEFSLCIIIQLSLVCWFGNEITRASEMIRTSLFESDWFSCSPRFKQAMILTFIRMQRPVYLSIGKFSPLTLATLVAICRGSFSYFAVFKSV